MAARHPSAPGGDTPVWMWTFGYLPGTLADAYAAF